MKIKGFDVKDECRRMGIWPEDWNGEFPTMVLQHKLPELVARAYMHFERNVPQGKWLPIETAPTDGTAILMRVVDRAGDVLVERCSWK
ncbi:MAG: hypothetical protein ACK5XN_00640, partial [Bacteroidota bacterium]